MLTSHKLLYILPEVAYITELLPTKKEHTYAIQAFRQINGDFIDENEFIAENIEKLINKLDAEEYHLILPDFLFTNTIVEVAETDETKVVAYLKNTLLPELTLSSTTHELKTFVLNTYGGKSKVQLSALEKSLMNPVSTAAIERGITITGISPISWTIKSIVSLEPSISVIQMGSNVYLSQHYIGIDQAVSAKVEEIETIAETIKTLKGAEPSIQTVYLITNSLVEEELKTLLSNTLPLQQLASFKEEDSEMPSYVKYCIEAGMKTLSIEAFPVPRFPLPEPTEEVTKQEKEEPLVVPTVDIPVEPAQAAVLPKPKELSLEIDDDTANEEQAESDTTIESSMPEPTIPTETAIEAPIILDPIEEPSVELPSESNESSSNVDQSEEKSTSPELTSQVVTPTEAEKAAAVETKPEPKSDTPIIIKNQSGIQPMLKMLGVSFLVFLVTIGVGIGIGRAFIYFTQKQSEGGEQQTPLAQATPSPTTSSSPSPSPSASASAAIDPSKLSILVVNATTKAGYAGTSKTKLQTAKFGTVTAGNAKGKYEAGTYVLMETENKELLTLLNTSLGTTLTYKSDVAIEDPQGEYDAVVVLAE